MAERNAKERISYIKKEWSEDFQREYDNLVNKVTYKDTIEDVKDMTDMINSLKKMAMILSKVFILFIG